MIRLRLCLLLCAALLIAGGCSEETVDDGLGYPDTLTIMTYNVEDLCYNVNNEKPNSTDNTTAYDGVASMMFEYEIGVIGFQEIQPGSSRTDFYGDGSISSQGDVTGLNTALQQVVPDMHHYAFSSDGGIRRDFTAAWSRYPLYDITSIRPPTMRRWSRNRAAAAS